ncbi:MAG: acyl-CoA dehydrogenase family protein [Candidatus Palauibacterales bacterium]|nr:acyl-CoA dehydrogenase family protein [Candidatus Palauibacterales bacterium]MDP2582895.1 acyl-CoA dehydrogenase family protein [Candidatus Palauibacterales bacterium]
MADTYGDIDLTEEQLQICRLARRFAEEEVLPGAVRRDRDEDHFDRAIVDRLGELGFLGMMIPEAWDGLGLGLDTYLMALEEIARADASVAVSMSVHNSLPTQLLLRHGTEEQRDRWLRPMARGELLGAFSLSEAGSGSDAASLSAQARRDGDDWVLSGEKMWATNGASADLILLFARTDTPEDRRGTHGIGAFIVPTDAPGYRAGKKERKLGLRGSETVAVHLEDVRLGPEHLLGEPGEGYRYALGALEGGRLGIAAQAVGIAGAALEHAVAYAAEREQFGRPIKDFQGLRFKLARMGLRVEASRALLHRAARVYMKGETRQRMLSSMAKLEASEAAMEVTREAVQVLGGYGYTREYPVERLFRDAKVTEIYEGTSEVHQIIIAKELYSQRGTDQ